MHWQSHIASLCVMTDEGIVRRTVPDALHRFGAPVLASVLMYDGLAPPDDAFRELFGGVHRVTIPDIPGLYLFLTSQWTIYDTPAHRSTQSAARYLASCVVSPMVGWLVQLLVQGDQTSFHCHHHKRETVDSLLGKCRLVYGLNDGANSMHLTHSSMIMTPGVFHGIVADTDCVQVLRVEVEPFHIPAGTPLPEPLSMDDYDYRPWPATINAPPSL